MHLDKEALSRKATHKEGAKDTGFAQGHVDKLLNSMQPYMTRYASDADMKRLMGEAKECVKRKATSGKLLGKIWGKK